MHTLNASLDLSFRDNAEISADLCHAGRGATSWVVSKELRVDAWDALPCSLCLPRGSLHTDSRKHGTLPALARVARCGLGHIC